jgi:hypothetical protein
MVKAAETLKAQLGTGVFKSTPGDHEFKLVHST